MYEHNIDHTAIEHDIVELGEKIKVNLGLDWPDFTPQQSKYMLDLYDETINLGLTYYKQ
jgi:hypothetical protein